MRIETSHWLGREFLSIIGEGPEIGDPEAEADALFVSFGEELTAHGLSLDNTIRSRIWAADSDARTACSTVRTRTLSGPARAATSSYIAPAHFDSGARVAMDLIALRPLSGDEKTVTEQDPPKGVIKYLTVGELLVLPGMTSNEGGSFEHQAADILGRITMCLREAGCGWSEVCDVTLVHEHGVQHNDIWASWRRETEEIPSRMTLLPAEGYARPGKLLEIETMAIRNV
jgi:enamine deaminase RidA (YjgF/YER057c/UK114 family)